MAIAISSGQQFEYILEADRELDDTDPRKTRWKLRTLTRVERLQLKNAVGVSGGEMTLAIGTQEELSILAGLVDCEGLQDADGNPIPFEKSQKTLNILGKQRCPPSDAFLDRIHPDDLLELANAIGRVGSVTVEEGKD
ncbi:MAG: hypothetical protein ACPGWS_09815 [Solirubrobacterales bacterium]